MRATNPFDSFISKRLATLDTRVSRHTLFLPFPILALLAIFLTIETIGCDHSSVTSEPPMPIRFQVGISDDLVDDAQDGRLMVILAEDDEREPRELLEDEEISEKPVALALNVSQIHAGESIILSDKSVIYGMNTLADLKPGLYFVQALLNKNNDIRSLNAEGNLVSDVQRLRLDPKSSGTIRLTLNRELTLEEPVESARLKYVTLQSKLLSDFHHRPIFLHAGIVLPRDYELETERH